MRILIALGVCAYLYIKFPYIMGTLSIAGIVTMLVGIRTADQDPFD